MGGPTDSASLRSVHRVDCPCDGRARRADAGQDRGVEVLSSRILLRPSDPDRSRRFYRDTLGLAIFREFGPAEDPGVVFFLGQGFLEVSGRSATPSASRVAIWIQVRDVAAEYARLRAAGVAVLREPRREPWGFIEAWIEDPDGIHLALIQIPEQHPLRRDQR